MSPIAYTIYALLVIALIVQPHIFAGHVFGMQSPCQSGYRSHDRDCGRRVYSPPVRHLSARWQRPRRSKSKDSTEKLMIHSKHRAHEPPTAASQKYADL